jgi:hypothetical protein
MSGADGVNYTIRVPERVNREAEEALVNMAHWNGSDENPTPEESVRLSLEWFDAYHQARASLANFPQRCPLVPERRTFTKEVRQLLFRRAPSAPVWRILFVIEQGDDGPVVRLIHLRAGVRKPIGQKEAKDLLRGR